MKIDVFEKLLNRRLLLIRDTLHSKGDEYSTEEDRLHNFKEAAALTGEWSSKVLLGMLVKHWVSIQDLVSRDGMLLLGGNLPPALIDEKIGDAINYLILLEAVLKEE